MMEDTKHLFLSCDFFGKLWYNIFNWLGFNTISWTRVKPFISIWNLKRFFKKYRLKFYPYLAFHVCGWFGLKEMLGYFIKKRSRYNNCSTKLSFNFIGGWKRIILILFSLMIICGGLISYLVLTSICNGVALTLVQFMFVSWCFWM
jgi:hypothetical protein